MGEYHGDEDDIFWEQLEITNWKYEEQEDSWDDENEW